MQEILVDKNGYKQFVDEIERLKNISIQNASSGSEAFEAATGDGWHDNFAFEESMRESRAIAKRIDDLMVKKKYIKVISDFNDEEHINLGDIVSVKMVYDISDIEYEKIKLTGNYFPNTDNDVQEITLNSPLGKALFKAKVGDSSSYMVGNKRINFEIISKEVTVQSRR